VDSFQMISGSLAISRRPRDIRDAFRGTSEGIFPSFPCALSNFYLLFPSFPFLFSFFYQQKLSIDSLAHLSSIFYEDSLRFTSLLRNSMFIDDSSVVRDVT